MTLSTIKIFLKKSWAWCVQHWRWLIFGIVALIAYLTGRKNSRGLWRQAELARKHYKAEAAAIEKAEAEKDKKIKLAVHEADKAVDRAEKVKTSLIDKLEKEKSKEAEKLLRD